MFWVALVVLLIISLFWAFFSLRKEERKPKISSHIKKELAREKILFRK